MNLLADEAEARAFVRERCSVESFDRLTEYVAALRDENEVQNLVSKGSLDQVWRRHIADSVQLLDLVSRETGPWLDLGSGAGLPGFVIAAIQPHCQCILIESRKLRTQWLERVSARLALSNCRVVAGDVHSVPSFRAGVISARAFAPLPRLIALSARFSTNQTEWVLPKGRSAAQEVAALPERLRGMFHVEQSRTDPEAGIIVGTGRIEAQP